MCPRLRSTSLTFLMAIAFTGVIAQPAPRRTSRDLLGFYLYIPFEYNRLDAGALNDYLGNAGLPKLREPRALVGLGYELLVSNVVVNFSLMTGGKKPKSDSAKVQGSFQTYGLTVGYDVLRSPWLSLYPYVGIRGGTVSYSYEEQTRNGTSVAAYLQTPLQRRELRGSRMLADAGVGFAFNKSVLLAMRLGMYAPLGYTRWKADGSVRLSDGPDLSFSYYLGCAFGFGKINPTGLRKSVPKPEAPAGLATR